jgi:hypothetical protein
MCSKIVKCSRSSRQVNISGGVVSVLIQEDRETLCLKISKVLGKNFKHCEENGTNVNLEILFIIFY